MPKALEGPSHSQLPELIVSNLPKLGIHRRVPVSQRVRGLYHLRIMADYRPSIPVEKRDATLAAGMMTEVFRRLKEAY